MPIPSGADWYIERSSYRYYEFGDNLPVAMDWDAGFPVIGRAVHH